MINLKGGLHSSNSSTKSPKQSQSAFQRPESSEDSSATGAAAISRSSQPISTSPTPSSSSSSASFQAIPSPNNNNNKNLDQIRHAVKHAANTTNQEILIDDEQDSQHNNNNNSDQDQSSSSSPENKELVIKREINKNLMGESPSSAKKPRLAAGEQTMTTSRSSPPNSLSTSPVNDMYDPANRNRASITRKMLEQNPSAIQRGNRHG